MALINCPECGNQMSDTAKKCPHCGYKVKKIDNKQILGIVLILIGIGGIVLRATWGMLFYEHLFAIILLYVGLFVCFLYSCNVFIKNNKILKYVVMSLISIGILLMLYFYEIDVRLSVWRYEREYLSSKENEPTDLVEKAGLDYIRKVFKNENISIIRYQYLNEEKCAQDDSPFKQFEGLSWGLFDYESESSVGQIWVFFKYGEPRFMTIRKNWKSELSDSEIILLLIDAWENKSQSDRDLDRIKNNVYREMQVDPSHQSLMRTVRGY